jgi:hypothetical protein
LIAPFDPTKSHPKFKLLSSEHEFQVSAGTCRSFKEASCFCQRFAVTEKASLETAVKNARNIILNKVTNVSLKNVALISICSHLSSEEYAEHVLL